MITESTGEGSNVNINHDRLTPNSIMHESSSVSASIAEEEQEKIDNNSSTTTTTSSSPPSQQQGAAIVDQQQQPIKKSSSVTEEEEEAEEEQDTMSDSSVASFHPPPLPITSNQPQAAEKVQKTPSDRYISDDIVGDEEKCRRKFAKMVLAASKFQKSQQQVETRPSHMALLFDVEGNIDMMRMVCQGKSEYHKFCG